MSHQSKARNSALIEHYYRFATADDKPSATVTRTALVLSHLNWAEQRRSGRASVRVFNPSESDHGYGSTHTVIETVTDDSPFIVDSLTMLLNSVSQGVFVKLHSVFWVERDADGGLRDCRPSKPGTESKTGQLKSESWTHFEIPRVLEPNELRALKRQIESALRDVSMAVGDWQKMLAKLRATAEDLEQSGKRKLHKEAAALLEWLADDRFTLLGYCKQRSNAKGASGASKGLGILRPKARRDTLVASRVTRRVTRRGKRARDPITMTKSSLRSTVHRPALLDDIRIEAYDGQGRIVGEHCFVGLFTSVAYNENVGDIPVLRWKVDEVMRRSGLEPGSHRGKALRHILDTFPRDELIQIGIDDLERISLGVMQIEERRKIRLFFWPSAYGDFFSCLVYLPRDGYSSRARTRVEALLERAFSGTLVDSQLAISDSTLARLTFTVLRTDPTAEVPGADALQAQLVDIATSWVDRAREALLEAFPDDKALTLHARLVDCFPVGYQDSAEAGRLSRDFSGIESVLSGKRKYRFDLVGEGSQATFTAILAKDPIPLFVAEPVLDNMGLLLQQETSHRLEIGEQTVWIQDFAIDSATDASLESADVAERFEQCFERTLRGDVENDGFNALVVDAGLDWRQVVVLRAYCKYLLQGGAKFSQAYMLDSLRRNAAFVTALSALFELMFDPQVSANDRDARLPALKGVIRTELDRVTNLDDDRILRSFTSVVHATLRTNCYQTVAGELKSYLSFKFDPAEIPELPEPRPMFEIFVYAPEVEGVHLRCGRIARGGLRWSDRREDFRTEVLGLMKAQQVKNTVIVPAGAKGGFVCKGPVPDDPAERLQQGIECYRTFLSGLLDVTDNLVGGVTEPPPDVVCRDDPDPYLVVAADKGTATFSDIANGISAEYGFWLGDAFASGGSAGYDHKKMGITARGAWEAVKRHFREMGVDSQCDPFTVVGIGDMAGDVFGNGMLLSEQIRLVAAFNHKHIFIDPNPDTAASFAERTRLFALPRSGWNDYDQKLLSKGGGIYDRHAKSIRLSAEARTALGVDEAELTPPELVRAILLAPVDLLWNGGIGTYVKASTESDAHAADPANDAVRVDGRSLRCRVVAEGGNLGLTQQGRVEYALTGGRVNTDFIDNSAGVDSSDREVNIKILLNEAIRTPALKAGQRDNLLAAMTDEVAELVLASNYAQTQALSMSSIRAHERLGEHARLIRILEGRGILNRAIEFLPNEEEIEERQRNGLGFTRPELAIILSYAKIELFESLIATDMPEELHWEADVLAYFPTRLTRRFADLIGTHQLRREIAAMLVSSSMVNRMGPTFALRARDDTGADVARVTRAYAIVRALFGTKQLWRDIEALDGEIQAQVQYECFFECSRMLRRAVYWYLHRGAEDGIAAEVASKQAEVEAVLANLSGVLCGIARSSLEQDVRNYESFGVPKALGARIAALRLMTQILDIADLSREFGVDATTVARLYFELGRGLRLDWIREQVELLSVKGHWRAMARGTLRETLGREQHALLARVLERARGSDPAVTLAEWLTEAKADIAHLKRTLDEMQTAEEMDFAMLSIALREISRLC